MRDMMRCLRSVGFVSPFIASKRARMSHQRNPRALLTPAMRNVLDRMARTRQLPLHALTPPQARQLYEMGSGMLDIPGHKLARVEDLQFPVRDGGSIPARLYAPATEKLPVLMYFHCGGFTLGPLVPP